MIKPEMKAQLHADLLAAMREILRIAIMTMAALRDPDLKYLGWTKMSMHVVHDLTEAYGYSAARVRRFQPSPRHIDQMEKIAPWLAWLRREEGDQALRRMMAWGLGAPLWRMAQREKCSERTVQNRIDRSVAQIVLKFTGANLPVEIVDEPVGGVNYAIIFGPPDATSGGEVRPMRIYVGGKGFFRTRGDNHGARWERNNRYQVEPSAS